MLDQNATNFHWIRREKQAWQHTPLILAAKEAEVGRFCIQSLANMMRLCIQKLTK